MRFNSVLISSFLLVSVGLTDCRRTGRRSRPYSGVEWLTNVRSRNSSNWAGAELGIDNGAFYSVIGTFTIPEISSPSSSGVSAWVGIDGDGAGGTCGDRVLQAGVTIYGDPVNGHIEYDAWYEWFPANAVGFEISNFFSVGDVIGLVVGAPVNSTYGIAMIENRTKKQAAIANLSSTYALCGQTAEWIVEASLEDDEPFPNFSPVTFTDVRAYTIGGQTYGPQNATIINITNGSEYLTSASVSEDSVTIEHV
ncbi:peptidase G1 [Boletus edulis]|nr:peptidase G1 [Boletus edulis]